MRGGEGDDSMKIEFLTGGEKRKRFLHEEEREREMYWICRWK